jgi:predicted negative regulator of RcsB-dependent stress response
MDAYQTEDEQVEALKRWLKEYGRSVVFGIGMCLVLVFGWRAWQDHSRQTAQSASAAFDNLQQAVSKATAQDATDLDRSTLETLAEPILDQWSDMAYADLSRLLMAKAAVHGGDLDRARTLLTAVVDGSKDEAIVHMARQRLARVILSLGDYDAALDVLNVPGISESVYYAAHEEIRGDILSAKGDVDQAREAYEAAQRAEKNKRPFTEIKLNDLK